MLATAHTWVIINQICDVHLHIVDSSPLHLSLCHTGQIRIFLCEWRITMKMTVKMQRNLVNPIIQDYCYQ